MADDPGPDASDLLDDPDHDPPPPAEAGGSGAIGRLRAEVEAATDGQRRARLLGEIGEIEEAAGDVAGAARDYLAAYNAHPEFREPLEALLRVVQQNRSAGNFGKLVDTLLSAASTPEERSRALLLETVLRGEVQGDWQGARSAARETIGADGSPHDTATAWLMLERIAGKLDDPALREEALTARSDGAKASPWRDLLRLDVARLMAAAGATDPAIEVLRALVDDGSRWALVAAEAIERVVSKDPGLEGSREERSRRHALAEALEAQARLIQAARGASDHPIAVPAWKQHVEYIVYAFVRAAATRRSLGEHGKARALLEETAGFAEEAGPRIARIVARERIGIAGLLGDTGLAASLAEPLLADETAGPIAAALAMRVAEHAASEGDVPRVLAALTRATERDAGCLPARALELDVLAEGASAEPFAKELAAFSASCGSDQAKARAHVLAAYLLATRDRNAALAAEHLANARAAGLPPATAARLGRSLASVARADAWYREALEELVALEDGPDRPQLLFELARARLLSKDTRANETLAALALAPESAWLARALEVFAADEIITVAALERLAQLETPGRARDLALLVALRLRANGDLEACVARLEALLADQPHDVFVATLLAEMERGRGRFSHAARALVACADASLDLDLGLALRLEAALSLARAGDTSGALSLLESAESVRPGAALPLLAWVTRAAATDDLEARRAAIARELDAGHPPLPLALESFALEASAGDADAAGAALARLEESADGDLAVAAALARMVWPAGTLDSTAFERALETLRKRVPDVAAAEAVRHARDQGPIERARAAAKWLDLGGGQAAAMDWLGAALVGSDPAEEVAARLALSELLADEGKEAMAASASLLDLVLSPQSVLPFVAGTSHAVRLANLEIAPPGSDPRRRGAALSDLGGSLGDDAEIQAAGLAGWSALAARDASAALELFRTATYARPDDIHAWEGMRASAAALGDREALAIACEQLGARSMDDARGSALWEEAGLAWLELGHYDARAESALEASLARDPCRAIAFDRLFRRVRERTDAERLLALITTRLAHSTDAREVSKLYWEQARVLREKGDPEGALAALVNVTNAEPDHVGALALTGEIFIRRGMFEEAAHTLARLSRIEGAPPKNRVTAGVAAVDLLENKLGRPELALGILADLHKAKLSTLPVRDRLARTAARSGAWAEATAILEELMSERPTQEGRMEAARLAMAIHRDRLKRPEGAIGAIARILEELPANAEAVDYLLGIEVDRATKTRLLGEARDVMTRALVAQPRDAQAARRLARVAHALADHELEHSAVSVAVALGGAEGGADARLAQILAHKSRTPQMALTDATMRSLLAPGDEGPIADLFAAMGPTLAEALGPGLVAAGITKKDRVDPRAGLAIRNEIAAWAGAFGISTFDLYVGGKDPHGVQGVPGEVPAIIVGPRVNAPLPPAARARVAGELLGLVRGTAITRWRDDTTLAAIVVATCNVARVPIQSPHYAVLSEVERLIGKTMSRKTRSGVEPLCRAVAAESADVRAWAPRARASYARIGAIAAGDAACVLADLLGDTGDAAHSLAREDLRAEELLRFVLSPLFHQLRRTLGLEGAA